MKRFRPIHGIVIVPIFVVGIFLLTGGLAARKYERVSPAPDGTVHIDVSDLGKEQIRFYRFLNRGNQEVKFLIARDQHGVIQVGFDASETHAKVGRGFRLEGDWIIDNKCETASHLDEINDGSGGCRPVPLAHHMQGQQVVLAQDDILKGWRLFN